MPRQLFPTRPKPMPDETEEMEFIPEETDQIEESPSVTLMKNENPEESQKNNTVLLETNKPEGSPENSPKLSTVPEETQAKAEMPQEPNAENCVTICGHRFEIKPTKVTYFRNKTATTYNLLKEYPLTELMLLKKGVVDEKRDGDQIVYDFLIACLDDKDFVKEHYNDINADEIEQIIRIAGRLNHTDEKLEQLRKNREAQGSR